MKLDNKEKIYTYVALCILLIIVSSLPFFYKKEFTIIELPLLIINISIVPYLIISYIYKRS